MEYLREAVNFGGETHECDKPNFCPHCGTGIDARIANKAVLGRGYFAVVYQCTVRDCRKFFFSAYFKSEGLDIFCTHPRVRVPDAASEISALSPRFCDLYGQSAEAEASGNFDLAACGYRNAVEALVKDFAVKHKGAVADAGLMRKPLQDCIADYLDGLDEAVSAYMVKEFGNSAAHYPQLGRPFDFSEQKAYLEAFLQYMAGKLKILGIAERLPQKHLLKFQTPDSAAPAPCSDGQ